MKSRAKVSVLVPIYNVEDFLSECLDSLVKQTLREIEIICINDGSTDSSLEIIKSYAKDDKRIVNNFYRLFTISNWCTVDNWFCRRFIVWKGEIIWNLVQFLYLEN